MKLPPSIEKFYGEPHTVRELIELTANEACRLQREADLKIGWWTTEEPLVVEKLK